MWVIVAPRSSLVSASAASTFAGTESALGPGCGGQTGSPTPAPGLVESSATAYRRRRTRRRTVEALDKGEVLVRVGDRPADLDLLLRRSRAWGLGQPRRPDGGWRGLHRAPNCGIRWRGVRPVGPWACRGRAGFVGRSARCGLGSRRIGTAAGRSVASGPPRTSSVRAQSSPSSP
jgi:hypothetical protein